MPQTDHICGWLRVHIAVAAAALAFAAIGPTDATSGLYSAVDTDTAHCGYESIGANSTIVVFRDRPSDALAEQYGLQIQSIADLHYTSGRVSDQTIHELSRRGLVAYVEQDKPVRLDAAIPTALVQEKPPSWGLDRIDQDKLPLNDKYIYPKSAGEGVDVYVLDTGVDVKNAEFDGRAHWGAVFGPGASDGQVDDAGHGTFVAGVIAGKEYGVAKKAKIISVKVYRKKGDQTTEQVLQGIKWVLKQYQASGNKKALLNMSSGAPYNKVLNDAVEELTRAGLIVVTSAGNSGEQNVPFDSCRHSPSSASSVISVGATDRDDKVATFSNTGRCVTLFAPGVDVRSIGPQPGTAMTNAGTSFATPYVSGVVALMLAEQGPLSPADAKSRLVNAATKGVVKGLKSSDGAPNLLLNSQTTPWKVDESKTGQQTGSSSSGGSSTAIRSGVAPTGGWLVAMTSAAATVLIMSGILCHDTQH